MFTYKPRYAYSNWTPPPFNTIEEGRVFTLHNTGTRPASVDHAGDRRHVMFVGPSVDNSTANIVVSIYDTENYSNFSSRIPVTVATRTIRNSMSTNFCSHGVYRNYYASFTTTAIDSNDMQLEAGYYDFESASFKYTVLTKAQFWTPAFPTYNPPPIAGTFQRAYPYFIECGGKVFLFVYFAYVVNSSTNQTYSQYRVFEYGANGSLTFVQDLASSLGNYPNTLVNIEGVNRYVSLYTPTSRGDTVVINSFISNTPSQSSTQSGYIQTYLYNGTSFVPQYGEYTRLNGSGFTYAVERDGAVISLHFGSINAVASLMAYQHGASALTELAAYGHANTTYFMDKETNFMFSVASDVCNIRLFNSSNNFTTVGTITPAQLDALDPGMWGTNITGVGGTSVWVHSNAMILSNGSNPLGGRVRRMLVLGSAS